MRYFTVLALLCFSSVIQADGPIATASVALKPDWLVHMDHTECVRTGHIALTFDDGPSVHTIPLLDLLHRFKLKAAFFVVASRLSMDAGYAAAVKRAYQEGHVIGIHGWSHRSFLSLSTPSAVLEEMQRCSDAIWSVIGRRPRYFRPPFGELNQQVKEVLHSDGYRIIGWSIDTLDWQDNVSGHDVMEVLAKAMMMSSAVDKQRGKRPQDIILMHDLFAESIRAVSALPAWLEKHWKGKVRIVPLDQCLSGKASSTADGTADGIADGRIMRDGIADGRVIQGIIRDRMRDGIADGILDNRVLRDGILDNRVLKDNRIMTDNATSPIRMMAKKSNGIGSAYFGPSMERKLAQRSELMQRGLELLPSSSHSTGNGSGSNSNGTLPPNRHEGWNNAIINDKESKEDTKVMPTAPTKTADQTEGKGTLGLAEQDVTATTSTATASTATVSKDEEAGQDVKGSLGAAAAAAVDSSCPSGQKTQSIAIVFLWLTMLALLAH